jgi:hypothetical protein
MKNMRQEMHTKLIGKCERKRSLDTLRRILVDNIKVDLREMVFEVVYWIHLAQGKVQ